MRVKLSKSQFYFLNYYLKEDNEKLFNKLPQNILDHNIHLDLDNGIADDIRDWAGKKQQVIGFDKDYELTSEGKILEELIDAFFTG